METNRQALRGHFALRLLEHGPQRVLDVGCGSGELLAALATAGVDGAGLEGDRDDLAASRARGLKVVRGDAAQLPFADECVDWVTLRHVPHHLERPRAALAEAWRVARVGLLLAEPWFDDTRPGQRLALRADRWLKRQDRRAGRFHADALSAAELIALLPAGAHVAATETYSEEHPWTPRDLMREAELALSGLTPTFEDQREFESLLELARRGGMTLSGSLILEVRK